MADAALMLRGVVVDGAKQVAGAFFTASTRSIGGAAKGAVRGVEGMVESAGTSVTGLFRPDNEVENAKQPYSARMAGAGSHDSTAWSVRVRISVRPRPS